MKVKTFYGVKTCYGVKTICLVILTVFTMVLISVPTIAQASGKVYLGKQEGDLKVNRGLTKPEKECIECHYKNDKGKVHDWALSLHARANVTCLDCHKAKLTDKDAMDCPGTEKYSDLKISPIVTPLDCSKCHPMEHKQFARSKHARTWEIVNGKIKDSWMKGMANGIERSTGCYACHGSDISDGKLTVENWPNQGCGRQNPDGSFGSCVICHTTHIFSIEEARKPENCGQCHMGPDHPQSEIYFESKHGKRYLAEGHKYTWDAAPDTWEPGTHFRSPTCAVCHMSGVGDLSTTHDVSERLKWEAQAPLTKKNLDFDPEEGRKNMLTVCTQCHSPRWANNYLTRYDRAIENYDTNYFKLAKNIMNELYEKNILTKWPYFDEEIEWVFYEFWHHEGRRARMGAAMMGPDYAWWHGFYELKKHYGKLVELAEQAKKDGHGSPRFVPGSGGKNLTPANVDALPDGWKKVKHLKGMPK